MAGITDAPFRALCHRFGAHFGPTEMLTSDTRLWRSAKSRSRLAWFTGESPRAVQLAGSEPAALAEAARLAVAAGAERVDLNLGCPAKKVCNRAAGSALLADLPRVKTIFEAVVDAVPVPVTVKTRTGPDDTTPTALALAELAEAAGIRAIALHGRTRAARFTGIAEHLTAAQLVRATRLPVYVNGDITSAQTARQALAATGAAGVMIGRGALGNPWLFREVAAALSGLPQPAPPSPTEVIDILLEHIGALGVHYGPEHGARLARKHISWYAERHLQPEAAKTLRQAGNSLHTTRDQCRQLSALWARLQPSEEDAA